MEGNLVIHYSNYAVSINSISLTQPVYASSANQGDCLLNKTCEDITQEALLFALLDNLRSPQARHNKFKDSELRVKILLKGFPGPADIEPRFIDNTTEPFVDCIFEHNGIGLDLDDRTIREYQLIQAFIGNLFHDISPSCSSVRGLRGETTQSQSEGHQRGYPKVQHSTIGINRSDRSSPVKLSRSVQLGGNVDYYNGHYHNHGSHCGYRRKNHLRTLAVR